MKKVLLTAAFIGSIFAASAQNAGKIYLGADLLNIDYSNFLNLKASTGSPVNPWAPTSPLMPLIGFNSHSGPNAAAGHPNEKSSTGFGLNINGGYFLNNNWAVGMGIGFSSKSSSDTSGGATGTVNETKFTSSNFMIMPYVRYCMPLMGNWSLLADAGISYMSSNTKSDDAGSKTVVEGKASEFKFFVRPGFMYSFNERWSIVGTLSTDFLGFNSKSSESTTTVNGTGTTTKDPSNSEFGLNLNPLAGLSTTFGLYYSFGGGASK